MEFDKEKVQQWLDTYWKGSHSCPICNSDAWLLMEKVWELKEFQGGASVISRGQPVLPVVALMCNVCGHTIFFNAIAVRALSRAASREGRNE